MVEISQTTSRRALLGAIAVAPMATIPASAASMRRHGLIDAMTSAQGEEPVNLVRSRKGRSESRFRYHNAESFFAAIEKGTVRDGHDWLYQTGIVLQLGLSSHLLDVGFADQWCARHIGLDVTRSLACANATGFKFALTDFDALAAYISPYGKWRLAEPRQRMNDLPFTTHRIRMLTRELLDHVHRITGHPRPRGWTARHG